MNDIRQAWRDVPNLLPKSTASSSMTAMH